MATMFADSVVELLDPDAANEFNSYRMRLSETTAGLA